MKKKFILLNTLIAVSLHARPFIQKPVNFEQSILIVSVQKSGTHLVGKLLHLLTGQKHKSPGLHGDPHKLRPKITAINSLNKSRRFSHIHAPYSPDNLRAIIENKVYTFFIYRDPRDHIVSSIHHGKQRNRLSLITAILKNPITHNQHVDQLYRSIMPWAQQPYVCTLRFEDLIGPRGGGSQEAQLDTIIRVAHHLGMTLTRVQAQDVADKLFGGTVTFYEGKIGSWKEYFTPEIKDIFKKNAGQLLIDLGYETSLNW